MSTYIDTPEVERWGKLVYEGHFWEAHTFTRLEWLYGTERARAIMAGRDPATLADLEAWNALGRRDAA